MIIVVLVQWVVVSFQYDNLVFVVVLRCLFVFEQFEQTKCIRLEARNQINYR